MLPGWSVHELFRVRTDDTELSGARNAEPNDNEPTQSESHEQYGDLVAVFTSRSDFTRRFPPGELFDGATDIYAAGLSLNLLCQQFGDRLMRSLINEGCEIRCLLLDPQGDAIRRREDEEGYDRGVLSSLTGCNLQILARIRAGLPEAARTRLLVHVRTATLQSHHHRPPHVCGPTIPARPARSRFTDIRYRATRPKPRLVRYLRAGCRLAVGEEQPSKTPSVSFCARRLRTSTSSARNGELSGNRTVTRYGSSIRSTGRRTLFTAFRCARCPSAWSRDRVRHWGSYHCHSSALYHGAENRGAFRDDEPIATSRVDEPSAAIVSIGDYEVASGAEERNRVAFAVTAALAADVQRVRMLGSAAIDLAWVAEGKLDAAVILANKPWDTSAGTAIAREAGAIIVDRDGSLHEWNSTATIAFTPSLRASLLPLLRNALATRT